MLPLADSHAQARTAASSDALVLFGGTGDLARKKIYPALLAMVEDGHLDVPVIAVARKALGADGFRQYVQESLPQARSRQGAFAKLARLLGYVQGDYGNPAIYGALRRALRSSKRPLYYLAIPPDAFPAVVSELGRSGAAWRILYT